MSSLHTWGWCWKMWLKEFRDTSPMALVTFISLWGLQVMGRKKTKSSWKPLWRHVMAAYICKPKWELCALKALQPHIFYLSETLRWECWQDHNREQPPERIQSSSSSSYLHCLGSHKGGHSASPLPSETLPAPAGLIPGLGRSGQLPWISFSIQKNEGNEQLTPPKLYGFKNRWMLGTEGSWVISVS